MSARKRYTVAKPLGRNAIMDTQTGKVYAFGPGFNFSHVSNQQHRATYSEVDAVYLTEWLNERETGYKTLTPADASVLR